jgi:ABC-type antimicrobial peptide transport system permease subunit
LGRRVVIPRSPEDILAPDGAPKATVVGVVESIRMHTLIENGSERNGAYYFPNRQISAGFLTFAVRTGVDAHSVIEPMRKALAEIDPQMPLFSVRTQRERLELSVADRRTPMLLVAVFAGSALLLAAVGVYGMLAYQVQLRMREIGIRAALGATTARTFRMVLGEGLLILAVGLSVGMVGALALRKVITSQLYEVSPSDPRILAAVVVLLSTVAIVASLVPARRATRVDPVEVLVQE